MSKKDIISSILDFKGLKITLASPEDILSWSYGEVTKPETINYRTLRPEKDGLFDERIFGPTKDWECYCGKYKRIRYRGIICDKCGVEVTQSKVRRERMGHIKLATPIVHVWFFKGMPSKLSSLLDIPPRALENIVYFAQYLVIEVEENKKKKSLSMIEDKFKEKRKEIENNLKVEKKKIQEEAKKEKRQILSKFKNKEARQIAILELSLKEKQKITSITEENSNEIRKTQEAFEVLSDKLRGIKAFSILTEEEFLKLKEYNADISFKIGMGAEAILSMVKKIDLSSLAAKLRLESEKATGGRYLKLTKRLRLVEGLKKSGIDPTWMVLTALPVIPPDLRPMVQLSGGRFATSDLNDLYRRVINRNNRLKHLIDLGAPEIILRNEKRMLQEAVDSLIDTAQRPQRRILVKKLRSLSDMLRGKQGRFRQNLLGKRVDYSGRSVIVVGPELSLTQCGLPKEMALEMFKPFILRELIVRGFCPNVKSAKNFLDRLPPEVFDILEEITRNHPILLNRAPTLHKLGIQAFYPILIEGGAIRIHPCVCAGYNADFDGDQMAVHVPLSKVAQEEAINLMLPTKNLLRPADGSPITLPNKEMALGCYYLTTTEETPEGQEGKNLRIFSDKEEAILAYQTRKINVRKKIKVRMGKEILETTVGRILFNDLLPAQMRFINRPVPAASLKELITRALEIYSGEEVARIIDNIKDLGFWGATLAGGTSFSIFDCEAIAEKNKIIKEAEGKVGEIDNNYKLGLITVEEKKRLSNQVWIETTEEVANKTWQNLAKNNPIKIIIESGGARASRDQLKQLAAMRGLVVDPLGKIVEIPTKSNFREGLSVFEYVTSARGSRKGLTDSALKTADAGYLTRRLIDVSHEAIVRVLDCKTEEGVEIKKDDPRVASFEARILGRIVAKKIVSPKTKKIILRPGEEITEKTITLIRGENVDNVYVRSPLACAAKYGLCAQCYGWDFGTRKLVEVGTPVGIIAAQSIGEPGTQLTMRVKHAGGIVGLDVTQGLPRVEELFEARTPKVLSPIAEISGQVSVEETPEGYRVRIKSKGPPVEEREYLVPLTSELKIEDGERVLAGQQLASGFLDIKGVLEVRGLRGAQRYLISEIQKVYESQGIPINDKHFEVVVREMSSRVMVENPGETTLLPGELVGKRRFEEENARVLAEGGEPAIARIIVLGVKRAALTTESWLSAASFEETTNVLTESALKGEEDRLLGMKENVIIGRLIPTSPERAKIEE